MSTWTEARADTWTDYWVRVRRCERTRDEDFYLSRYPVVLRVGWPALAAADGDADTPLYRPTWAEAQAFCASGALPPALIPPDAAGPCRLPTPSEWERAAQAWSGQRSGAYITWMQQHYKVPGLDQVTPEQVRTYAEGYARIAELTPNAIGLHGLLGYAREWCAAAPGPQGDGAGQFLHWEEYFTNYDNAIGYQVRCRPAEVGLGLAFRLACSAVAV